MFLSGNGENTVKTVKINDKFEKIDFRKWMIESRCISHKLIQRGHELSLYKLQVRYLLYEGKTYAFNVSPDDSNYIQIPLLVDEDGIISAYQIALDGKYYQEFLEKYLNASIKNLGVVVRDDLYKLIIELFNNMVEYGEAFPVKDMYCNQWDFDPMNFNEQYSSYNTKNIRESYNPKDIIKFIDNEKNVTYYGCIKDFDKNQDIALYHFKCYLLDYCEFDEEKEDETICFKFFLPDFDTGVINLLDKKKPRFEYKKTDVSELNESQKEIYEIYKENDFLR